MSEQKAWLIERGQQEQQVPTVWWDGLLHDWTTVAAKATRYGSREECETAIDDKSGPRSSDRFGRATEHVFLDRAAPKPLSALVEDVREAIGAIKHGQHHNSLAGLKEHVHRSLDRLVEAMRTRNHEVADECQKRHAPYVSRCAEMDQIIKEGRQWFAHLWADDPPHYTKGWDRLSEAERAVWIGLHERMAEKIEQARAEGFRLGRESMASPCMTTGCTETAYDNPVMSHTRVCRKCWLEKIEQARREEREKAADRATSMLVALGLSGDVADEVQGAIIAPQKCRGHHGCVRG